MLEVWKFELPAFTGMPTQIDMPKNAEILHVDEQRGGPFIWALVDVDAPLVNRSFAVFGTGQIVAENPMRHLGTVKLNNGNFILHVFELI